MGVLDKIDQMRTQPKDKAPSQKSDESTGISKIEALAYLVNMRDSGVISEDVYNEMKDQVISISSESVKKNDGTNNCSSCNHDYSSTSSKISSRVDNDYYKQSSSPDSSSQNNKNVIDPFIGVKIFFGTIAFFIFVLFVMFLHHSCEDDSSSRIDTISTTSTTAKAVLDDDAPSDKSNDRHPIPRYSEQDCYEYVCDIVSNINEANSSSGNSDIVYSALHQPGIITMTLMPPSGTALSIVYPSSSDIKNWNTIKQSAETTSKDIMSKFKEMGHSDIVFEYNILNDMNRDRILLSYVSGVLIYDAMSD